MMEKHKKPIGFECVFCLNTLLSDNSLEAHIKCHIGETSTLVAKKRYTDILKCEPIKTIKRTSTNNKTFGVPPCCQCQEVFSSRSSLKVHYKNVHTRKIYNCDLCANWYLNRRSLNRHNRMTHLGIVPNPKCEQCNLSFADTNLLWSHKKAVHLKKLFECSVCMKTYTASRSLQRHQRKTQHFPSKFDPPPLESKVKKPENDHLDNNEKKRICDSYKQISSDGNLKMMNPIKIGEKHASSSKTTGGGPLEERIEEFPVMLTLNITSPNINSSYLELLKSQPRQESNDMFFLHLNRYKINE